MPGISYDPSEDTRLWKGKTFVFQGQFNGTDGKPMDAMALTRLIRKHGGEVQACVPKKENARRGIMILLVTTIAEVKKHGRNVQRAVEIGRTRCTIVQFDFIVDTLHPGEREDGKPKYTCAQGLKYHSMERVLVRLKRHKEAREIYANRYYSEAKSNTGPVDPRTHHIYVDSTKFKYDVEVTHELEPAKVDKRGREKPVLEGKAEKKRFKKWTLQLYESNVQPRTYKFLASYSKQGQNTVHHNDDLGDAEFSEQFKEFKRVFLQKTGMAWNKRLDNITVTSLEKATMKGLSKDQGQTEAEDKTVFKYTPPPPGQPRGEMPKGWKDHATLLLEKEERKREKRLEKQEEQRKREIKEEKRVAREMKERQEKNARMAWEDEVDSQPSDCGWNSVGESSEDDDQVGG